MDRDFGAFCVLLGSSEAPTRPMDRDFAALCGLLGNTGAPTWPMDRDFGGTEHRQGRRILFSKLFQDFLEVWSNDKADGS